MPRVGDFEIEVTVEDRRLEEYSVQDLPRSNDAPIQKSCFIASSAGKAFKVDIRDLRDERTPIPRVILYLDGVQVVRQTIEHEVVTLAECHVDATKAAPFLFAPIKLTEHLCEAEKDEMALKNLSTIKAEIDFVEILGPASSSGLMAVKKDITVHERAKKGGGHFARLGDTVPARPRSVVSVKALADSPKLACIFSYAPKDWLRAKDIITSPASSPETSPAPSNILKRRNENVDQGSNAKKARPTAGPSNPKPAVKLEEHDDDLLDPEEARLFQELKNKIINKKQAQGVVKLEPLVPEPGMLRPGEVIDLTDD